MKTTLITSNPAQIETECLAVVAIDHGDKDKNEPRVSPAEPALQSAAAELFASGEVKGKIFEAVLLHRPRGLKAKRLLVIGGGKAKNFSSYELRKMAGTAVRFLKPKGIKSFAFVAPDMQSGMADSVRSVVEGALVGDFDPDTYKSDRKDLSMQEMTVVAPASGDQKALQTALDQARIIGESQNFTRELVNEPGNRMTPTMLADRAKKMCEAVKSPNLKCEVLDGAKIRELKMGAFWSVSQGSDEPPA